MTKEELVKHIQNNGCKSSPVEGINITGWQVKFENKSNPNNYAYIDMPINDKHVPDYVVRQTCKLLQIPIPHNIEAID